MPVAAIESLIAALGSTPSTTAMETVDVIRTQAQRLKSAVPNPIPLTAGTDLFQQYLLRSLKGQTAGPQAGLSFDRTRDHLLANGRLFAARAKAARDAIADRGSGHVLDGSVVLAAGGSRTVKTLLLRAADKHSARWGSPRFRVIYVIDDSADTTQGPGRDCAAAVEALRARGVPTATIGPEAVAHVLLAARVDMAFVGTEVIVQNGGLLSRMGTFQLATLCHSTKTPFYVAAETHKIVRLYPLHQRDLSRCGVQQKVLDFRMDGDKSQEDKGQEGVSDKDQQPPVDYTVRFTPPLPRGEEIRLFSRSRVLTSSALNSRHNSSRPSLPSRVSRTRLPSTRCY